MLKVARTEPIAADAGSPIELPYSLLVELTVRDPDLIAELVLHDEGRMREDYALCALRIGLIALKQVRGQLDGETIKRESERMLADMAHHLSQHAQEVHGHLSSTLRDYFDPASGRFHERVQRLTKEGGELEQLLHRHLGPKDSQLVQTLAAHFGAQSPLMKVLSPTESEGLLQALKTALTKALEEQRAHILKQFSLDEKDGALSRFKQELWQSFDEAARKNGEFQEKVVTSLAALSARRAEMERSTRHGVHFEDQLWEILQQESQKAGDLAIATGTLVGCIKNCKVGDCVIELGPEQAAAGAKIVVEAKEKADYTLAEARQEIETARKNRDALVGLFVFSKKTAPPGLEELVRYANDVFITWDAEDVQSDLYLRVGMTLAKALCTRQIKQQEAQAADFTALDKAILEVEKRTGTLEEITTWTTTIRNNSDKILERVRITREALEKQVTILRERTGDLRQADGTASDGPESAEAAS